MMNTTYISNDGLENADATEELNFGERVNFLIKKRGVTKRWLAENLGITKQALNYLINHASKPKYLDPLSELLKANPAWIEFGKGEPFIPSLPRKEKEYFSKLRIHNFETLTAAIRHEEPERNYDFIEYTQDNTKDFIAYQIEDDSLFPPFMEKTILIFDRGRSPKEDDYALIFFKEKNSFSIELYSPKTISVNMEIVAVLVEARYIL